MQEHTKAAYLKKENTGGIVEQTSRQQAVNRVGPLLMAKARGFNLPIVPFNILFNPSSSRK